MPHTALPLLFAFASLSWAVDEFEQTPIQYSLSTPNNCISKLQTQLARKNIKLAHDPDHGYLPSVLKALDVPVESQMFVFSKTSLQLRYITPKTPRAIYFNENVYVGYCQSGDVLEISAVDPQLGTVFYTLDQQPSKAPHFERQVDKCLICHSSSRTGRVPGHLVRSLFVDTAGHPMFSGGSHSVDHSTPMEQRWGGWYVTGQHGSQSHLGNLVIRGKDAPRNVDNSQGHNVQNLHDRLDVERYLSPHSDIVALMILEHQTMAHNRLTRANFTTRQALDYESALNKALGEPHDKRQDSTNRRIQSAGDDLIDCFLMVDEIKLLAPISGTSGYAEKFAKSGIRDRHHRSLHDLDLSTRLFKYPCSYLIHSQAFDELPAEMRNYVLDKLWTILSTENGPKKYAHLSRTDRQAIMEILIETKPGLPDYWKRPPQTADSPKQIK